VCHGEEEEEEEEERVNEEDPERDRAVGGSARSANIPPSICLVRVTTAAGPGSSACLPV